MTATATAQRHRVIMGLDISPTHAGLVALDRHGRLLDARCVCETKKEAAGLTKRPGLGITATPFPTELTSSKFEDPDGRAAYRLVWMRSWLQESLASFVQETFELEVAVENYAFHMKQGAHQIGETGGMARLLLLDRPRTKVRLYDPVTVKMFATGVSQATKEMVGEAILRDHAVRFDELDLKPTTVEDLQDAYAIARLAWTEMEVRAGRVLLKDLTEKQIQVFNRTTSAQPINLLDRDWMISLDA